MNKKERKLLEIEQTISSLEEFYDLLPQKTGGLSIIILAIKIKLASYELNDIASKLREKLNRKRIKRGEI